MPITNKSQAKEGGFAQVRAALQKFEGDVTNATFDKWGGTRTDSAGNPLPQKEFMEISCENVEVLEVTEELSMPITEWNFRVNCSEYKGSFWVDMFLESADKFKLQIPDGLIGKRIVFEKQTLEANDPAYNSTKFVIVGVKGAKSPKVIKGAKKAEEPEEVSGETTDPMEVAKALAVGKTEAQFKTAVALHPVFTNSPLLSLAKAGMLTQALVNEGKLVLVDGKYKLPD